VEGRILKIKNEELRMKNEGEDGSEDGGRTV
jgi:hypothetical protein